MGDGALQALIAQLDLRCPRSAHRGAIVARIFWMLSQVCVRQDTTAHLREVLMGGQMVPFQVMGHVLLDSFVLQGLFTH